MIQPPRGFNLKVHSCLTGRKTQLFILNALAIFADEIK